MSRVLEVQKMTLIFYFPGPTAKEFVGTLAWYTQSFNKNSITRKTKIEILIYC